MKTINRLLRYLFFSVIVRFIVLVVLGINMRGQKNLPTEGPAIIAANHNSHLDTLVLLNCLPRRLRHITKPVAAEDYFLKNKFIAWFATNIIGIIPIKRRKASGDPLAPCYEALEKNRILILFPEGTRGEPEEMLTFKKGISYIATKFPDVPIIPIYMTGLGKALPKGEFLLVPFFCDVFVGKSIKGMTDRDAFMNELQESFAKLMRESKASNQIND